MVEQPRGIRNLFKVENIAKALKALYLIFYTTFMLFPIIWMVSGAFKTDAEIFSKTPTIIPVRPTLSNFLPPKMPTAMWRWLTNSLIVSVSSASICSLIGLFGGYAFSRARIKKFKVFLNLLMIAYIFPPAFLIVGFTRLVNFFGLLDNLVGVILVYVCLQGPYNIYLIYSYMAAIPRELDDAAEIDGWSKTHVLFRLILPLSLPVIVTAFMWTFMMTWNELIYALVLLNSPSNLTMNVGLSSLQAGDISPYGVMFAGATVYASIPVVLFMFLQKYYILGLTRGGVRTA